LSIATTVNTLSQLTETLTWSGDGLLASHTLARADFTDSHAYAYANSSRRLTQEQLNLNAGTTWTNALTYDNGMAAGPGVLTQMGQASGTSNKWNGVADVFSRVSSETNNTFQFAAYGHVNGQSTLSGWLDSQPVAVTGTGTNAMQWRATMELTPGAHQLKVAAAHPSGFYTAWATNSFTNSIAYQATVDSYDSAGEITNRVWRSPNGTVDRTQTLSWDARGRLHAVTERDASNSGYNWTATYDGLSRRLSTTSILVTNGVTLNSQPVTINSYYDPQVEFLELGVSYGLTTEWKLYGPDLNGKYGGLNGTGGFDGVSPYLNLFYPTISDFRGNILGVVTNGVVSWNPARPTGYGAVPGYRPLALGNGASISLSSAWRGRWVDITGYYQIGLRPYDPVSGRWLTYDSVWNERDPNYYTFAGGEPIMGFDADGRGFWGTFFSGVGSDLYSTGARLVNGVVQAGAIGSDMIGQTAASAFGYGADYQGYSQLYQNIYNNPSSGPTASGVLLGTVNTELNIVTLGGAGVVEGGYTAYQTGNYNQLQDSFAGIAVAGGIARTVNNLAPTTYRGITTANPDNIFDTGFEAPGDNMSLLSHAEGSETGGSSSDSGFIATSQSPTVAQSYADWGFDDNGPVYGVQTWRAGQNVNAVLGEASPYSTDSEIAFPGGIYNSEINGYTMQNGNFTANPYFGLNSTYAGAVGTAYLGGALGTKR
jgi:RHS repeat-associated protein